MENIFRFNFWRNQKPKKKMVVREYPITADVKLLGHVFHGLEDIKQYVEMSLYKSALLRDDASVLKPKQQCEVHVGEQWHPYPCFDSSDAMYENRTYQSYIFKKRPLTQEDMRQLGDLPTGNNYDPLVKDVPTDLLPIVYYVGDGDVMKVATAE
ncbi:MAG: hypothetical protein IJ635_05620 [Bacteroidaceae bacterium]|nr:hypothetical protein [Bacteroidaceae bacterium]